MVKSTIKMPKSGRRFYCCPLLAIGGYALLGPTGILAWGEYRQNIELRQNQLADLQMQRDSFAKTRLGLAVSNVDQDLVSQLLRKEIECASLMIGVPLR
jgi:hypothetical protein